MTWLMELPAYLLIGTGGLLALVAFVLCAAASWEEPVPDDGRIESPLWTEETR